MTKPRPLREIAEAMESLNADDLEGSHVEADDLLAETIRRLAPYATDTVDEGGDERIIAAFRGLPKWYA